MRLRTPSLFLLLAPTAIGALGACAELDRGKPLREVADTVESEVADTVESEADSGPLDDADDTGDGADDTDGEADTEVPLSFAAGVHEALLDNCTDAGCHGSGAGGYALVDDLEADYQATLAEVTPGDALGSTLVKKATNTTSHGGGPILQTGTPEYQLIVDWIDDGANP